MGDTSRLGKFARLVEDEVTAEEVDAEPDVHLDWDLNIVCATCGRPQAQHLGEKCLFAAGSYTPEYQMWNYEGPVKESGYSPVHRGAPQKFVTLGDFVKRHGK